MDSLTQIVLGAAVGEGVLGRKVGTRAMLWGAIAGTIPDLDVFLRSFVDPITATEMHRGFSHSIVFAVLMAPVLGWIAEKIHKKRKVGRIPWSWLFFWALVTHPMLDNHTTWGTQFFWPFDYRVAYQNIFVVDPLYTLPFLAFTMAAMFHKRNNPRRQKLNTIGLIVSSTYMLLTIALKGISFVKFENSLEKNKIEYLEMDTRPTPLNTVLWNAQIQTEGGIRLAYYSFLDSKEISFSNEIPKNRKLLEPYMDQAEVKQIVKISAGWYFVQQEEDFLYFYDTRFGQFGFDPDRSPFMWKYKLTPAGNNKVTVERVPPDLSEIGSLGTAFSDLWNRIRGN